MAGDGRPRAGPALLEPAGRGCSGDPSPGRHATGGRVRIQLTPWARYTFALRESPTEILYWSWPSDSKWASHLGAILRVSVEQWSAGCATRCLISPTRTAARSSPSGTVKWWVSCVSASDLTLRAKSTRTSVNSWSLRRLRALGLGGRLSKRPKIGVAAEGEPAWLWIPARLTRLLVGSMPRSVMTRRTAPSAGQLTVDSNQVPMPSPGAGGHAAGAPARIRVDHTVSHRAPPWHSEVRLRSACGGRAAARPR